MSMAMTLLHFSTDYADSRVHFHQREEDCSLVDSTSS